MWGALAIFALSVVLIVAVNSFGHGFHIWYSISRYVGLETWSAILFALGNLVVGILMIYYLYWVGGKIGATRGYYWLIVIIVMALLGLSACPIGYFDLPGEAYASSAPSIIHECCSRVMFAAMLIVAAVFALRERESLQTRIGCGIFLIYGIFCVAGYLAHAEWFRGAMLVFESLYLIGFMVMCLIYGKEIARNGK